MSGKHTHPPPRKHRAQVWTSPSRYSSTRHVTHKLTCHCAVRRSLPYSVDVVLRASGVWFPLLYPRPPLPLSLSYTPTHTHTHRSALGDTQTRRVRVAFQFRTNPSQRVPTVPLIVPGLLLVLQLLLLLDGRFCTLSFEFVWLKRFRPGRGARTAIPAGRNRPERGPGRSQPGRGVGGALDSPSHSRHCTGRLCRAVRWRV